MLKNNQQLRELFTLPPIPASASTAIAVPEMPPQQVITGHLEVDAVLWLQSVVKTGNQGLIDKALEAAKRIKTPMKELEKRYTDYVSRANPGNVFAVLFATMGFGDLESQAESAIERAGRRHEALSRFGNEKALLSDTPAEKACIKALRGLKRADFDSYDDDKAKDRFAKHPALVPATLDDCLHVINYNSKLYWLRNATVDRAGDGAPQAYAHRCYCLAMLAAIPARDGAEALRVLDHTDNEDSLDAEEASAIARNLVVSGWAAAKQGASA